MTTDRASGLVLMIGATALIITLALHPNGHELFVPGQWEWAARKLTAVHSLALMSLPFLFLGALGLSRRLGTDDHCGTAAAVFYGFSMVAVMTAVVFDGLVSPGLARKILDTSDPARQEWRIAFHYNALVDLGFMSVFVVASSLAIVLWSASIVRRRDFSPAAGICGLFLGCTTVVGLVSGLMIRNEHLFILAIFAQMLWFLAIGNLLCVRKFT